MKLIFRKGRETHVVEDPDLVLVEDVSGNPIAVAAQFGMGGVVAVSSIESGDETFNATLRGLGIDKVVVRQELSLRQPETLPSVKI